MAQSMAQGAYIRWFDELGLQDVPLGGSKNASLGELYGELAAAGMQVPNGFAITAEGYRFFLQEAQLDQTMRVLLHDLKTHDLARLRHRGRQVCQAIPAVSLPLAQAIVAAADRLSAESAHEVDVAVRSSATSADLPDASFAGQQETYLMGQHHD